MEVDVCVAVGDAPRVGVGAMSVDVGSVFVGLGFGVRVAVWVHGINTKVLVGLARIIGVLVAEETVVGAGEDVEVARRVGNGVPVIIDTPGVRKLSIQPGWVRMDASTGSTRPPGRRVR